MAGEAGTSSTSFGQVTIVTDPLLPAGSSDSKDSSSPISSANVSMNWTSDHSGDAAGAVGSPAPMEAEAAAAEPAQPTKGCKFWCAGIIAVCAWFCLASSSPALLLMSLQPSKLWSDISLAPRRDVRIGISLSEVWIVPSGEHCSIDSKCQSVCGSPQYSVHSTDCLSFRSIPLLVVTTCILHLIARIATIVAAGFIARNARPTAGKCFVGGMIVECIAVFFSFALYAVGGTGLDSMNVIGYDHNMDQLSGFRYCQYAYIASAVLTLIYIGILRYLMREHPQWIRSVFPNGRFSPA